MVQQHNEICVPANYSYRGQLRGFKRFFDNEAVCIPLCMASSYLSCFKGTAEKVQELLFVLGVVSQDFVSSENDTSPNHPFASAQMCHVLCARPTTVSVKDDSRFCIFTSDKVHIMFVSAL